MKRARRWGEARKARKCLEVSHIPVRSFNVVIERDEDGWLVAHVPELPGCHTQARSQDQLLERVKEAIALYLEVRGPPPKNIAFIGVQRVEVET